MEGNHYFQTGHEGPVVKKGEEFKVLSFQRGLESGVSQQEKW